jgi:hypothetical protein
LEEFLSRYSRVAWKQSKVDSVSTNFKCIRRLVAS